MKKTVIAFTLLIATGTLLLHGQKKGGPAINLRYEENYSLSYDETIDAYRQLAAHYKTAKLIEMGTTDIGKPLHVFMISKDRDFNPVSIKKKGKTIVLINNGIHAGEPEGIDASIEYAMSVLANRDGLGKVLDNTVIAIIPIYNVGGALNRSAFYRLNQNGPEFKGARRNARNLDLNRDFVKQDSKNARSFAAIFNYLNPDVFLDTHTTNGSDHQFPVTLIPTMHQRMSPSMGSFFRGKMVPELYHRMRTQTPYDMVPYVQTAGRGGIRSGITAFEDHPYYSTGYAVLYDCFAFMTENLVYVNYPDRVKSVIAFITHLVNYTSENGSEIRALRIAAENETKQRKEYVLDWAIDTEKSDKIVFKGYETEQKVTPISNRTTTVYNHDKKWSDTIPFFNYFKPVLSVEAPMAYIVPQAWDDVIERMRLNGVIITPLERDTIIEVESYFIEKVTPSTRATQGRFMNTAIELNNSVGNQQYYKGDAVIYVNQRSNNYIVHMLEPKAPASFFTWNFFDSILEGGEFFSIWGFESHAKEMLDKSDELRAEFEKMKAADPDFASDPVAQLQYIYQKAPHSEADRGTNRYPVARLLK
jgi:hypothetical protein